MYFNTANKFYPNPVDTRRSTFKKNANEIKNKEGISISHLKSSIDSLMTEIEPSQNAKLTIASIMRLLGNNDNEIGKVIGFNQRGVISMPNSNKNKFKK